MSYSARELKEQIEKLADVAEEQVRSDVKVTKEDVDFARRQLQKQTFAARDSDVGPRPGLGFDRVTTDAGIGAMRMSTSPASPDIGAVKAKENRVPYVAKELHTKAELFQQRAAVYGRNYHRHGPIMAQLLATQAIDARNPRDMGRLGVLTQIVSKLTRYAENFNNGGHDDSLDDISVYAMMLKELDHQT